MLKRYLGKQRAGFLKRLKYHRVRLFNEYARPRGVVRHVAPCIHKLNEGHIVLPAHPVIVLAEGGGVVYYAGAVLCGNIIVGYYIKAPLAGLFGGFLCTFKQRLIAPADKLAALELPDYPRVLAKHLFNKVLRQYERLRVLFSTAIHYVRIYAKAYVRRQRPWRSGPGKITCVLIGTPEAYRCRNLLNVLIPLRHLMAGKSRSAARAIRHHLVPLV